MLVCFPGSQLHFSLHYDFQYQLSRISKICIYKNRSCVGKTKCDVKQIWVKICAVSLNIPGLSQTPLGFGFLVCKIGVLLIQGLWESEITNTKHIEQWVSSYKHRRNICCCIIVVTDNSHLRVGIHLTS